jgi:hypothetical protein
MISFLFKSHNTSCATFYRLSIFRIILFWKKEGIIDSKMEKDILEKLMK